MWFHKNNELNNIHSNYFSFEAFIFKFVYLLSIFTSKHIQLIMKVFPVFDLEKILTTRIFLFQVKWLEIGFLKRKFIMQQFQSFKYGSLRKIG